ncbi:Sadenosylmethionine synthetase, putative [Entamoeba histolytica KU27]|nr:Sadenosylmethionine synthetase, putative [Entamoeba histolytica KU27]
MFSILFDTINDARILSQERRNSEYRDYYINKINEKIKYLNQYINLLKYSTKQIDSYSEWNKFCNNIYDSLKEILKKKFLELVEGNHDFIISFSKEKIVTSSRNNEMYNKVKDMVNLCLAFSTSTSFNREFKLEKTAPKSYSKYRNEQQKKDWIIQNWNRAVEFYNKIKKEVDKDTHKQEDSGIFSYFNDLFGKSTSKKESPEELSKEINEKLESMFKQYDNLIDKITSEYKEYNKDIDNTHNESKQQEIQWRNELNNVKRRLAAEERLKKESEIEGFKKSMEELKKENETIRQEINEYRIYVPTFICNCFKEIMNSHGIEYNVNPQSQTENITMYVDPSEFEKEIFTVELPRIVVKNNVNITIEKENYDVSPKEENEITLIERGSEINGTYLNRIIIIKKQKITQENIDVSLTSKHIEQGYYKYPYTSPDGQVKLQFILPVDKDIKDGTKFLFKSEGYALCITVYLQDNTSNLKESGDNDSENTKDVNGSDYQVTEINGSEQLKQPGDTSDFSTNKVQSENSNSLESSQTDDNTNPPSEPTHTPSMSMDESPNEKTTSFTNMEEESVINHEKWDSQLF